MLVIIQSFHAIGSSIFDDHFVKKVPLTLSYSRIEVWVHDTGHLIRKQQRNMIACCRSQCWRSTWRPQPSKTWHKVMKKQALPALPRRSLFHCFLWFVLSFLPTSNHYVRSGGAQIDRKTKPSAVQVTPTNIFGHFKNHFLVSVPTHIVFRAGFKVINCQWLTTPVYSWRNEESHWLLGMILGILQHASSAGQVESVYLSQGNLIFSKSAGQKWSISRFEKIFVKSLISINFEMAGDTS